MSSPSVSALLERIAAAGKAFEDSQQPGAREDLIDLSQSLVAALEIPSEFIQRSFWSEVSQAYTLLQSTYPYLFHNPY